MRMSRKTDFQKLKIALLSMTYHNQRPQFPSLSPTVLLHKANPIWTVIFRRGGGGTKCPPRNFGNIVSIMMKDKPILVSTATKFAITSR